MKIIRNGVVYVQTVDIICLKEINFKFPASISTILSGNAIDMVNYQRRYDFLKFDEKDEVEFFSGLDWIIDYDTIRHLDENQIIELARKMSLKKSDILSKYNKLNYDARKANVHMIEESDKLEFQMNSLRNILGFMQGYLSFKLPRGIEYPEFYEKKKGNVFQKVLTGFKNNSNI